MKVALYFKCILKNLDFKQNGKINLRSRILYHEQNRGLMFCFSILQEKIFLNRPEILFSMQNLTGGTDVD